MYNSSCACFGALSILEIVKIKDLEPDLENIIVIGIIIGKQKPRKFDSKNTDEPNKNRAVWNFTIRDTPRDYINVTYWSTSEIIFAAYEKFSIGDIVEIAKPRVLVRKLDDIGEQFRPMVTSPYSLTLAEKSDIHPHNGNPNSFVNLLKLPTKPIAGFVPIRDLQNDGEKMKGRSVDILGAVRSVGNARTVTMKTGTESQVREIVLFDYTSPGIRVTIWENDIILQAARWVPRTTIIFITDIRVEYSPFLRCFTASLTNRSILTENPVGEEANFLAQYAASAELPASTLLDQIGTVLPDPSSIQQVMCVKRFIAQAESLFQEKNELTGLLYVFITKLDLDGNSRCFTVRCGYCKQWMRSERDACANNDCMHFRSVPPDLQILFDIKIDLTDHSGLLENCRLFGDTAERVLGCSVQQFLKMTDDDKCLLKWKYLMERCAVKVALTYMGRGKPNISVVSCNIAEPKEVAQKLSLVS